MSLVIGGAGATVKGVVPVSGAKNAFLPLTAAASLINGVTTLSNAPVGLRDATSMFSLLTELGCSISTTGPAVMIDSRGLEDRHLDPLHCGATRYSILLLSVLLRRFGRAVISLPGGCGLGETRPIDIHTEGLEAFGARIAQTGGVLAARLENERPGRFRLRYPSVGATLQLMLFAVSGNGTYILENCAREPEIAEVGAFLRACGGNISGLGSSRLLIHGTSSLAGVPWTVMPDRIEAATFAILAATCRGDLRIGPVRAPDVNNVADMLAKIGVPNVVDAGLETWTIRGSASAYQLSPCNLLAQPYPGLATDVHPLFAALLLRARGTSTIRDAVFPDRYAYVEQLRRLGARIHRTEDGVRVEYSEPELRPTILQCPDIRGGMACILGALLCKSGATLIENEEQIFRGYEDVVRKLSAVGVPITRSNGSGKVVEPGFVSAT